MDKKYYRNKIAPQSFVYSQLVLRRVKSWHWYFHAISQCSFCTFKGTLSLSIATFMFCSVTCACVCVLSHFSHDWVLESLWTIGCHIPLSMGFFRQEYWSGLPCPSPEDLPDPGIEPTSLTSPELVGGFFIPLPPPGKPQGIRRLY